MPEFFYQAYLTDGRLEKGTIEANDSNDAAKRLAIQKKNVFKIKQAGQKPKGNISFPSSNKLDLLSFFEDLSDLSSAGLRIDTALAIMSDNAKSDKTSKNAVSALLEDLRSGMPFSKSLAKEKIAPSDIVALISVGEETGKLSEILPEIAATLKRTKERKKELIEKLTYPLFLIGVMFVAIFAIATFLVPAIDPLFDLIYFF